MAHKNVHFVSLGCPKNRIDTETMLAGLPRADYHITPDAESADIVIINTCAFVESAKKESIDAILEARAAGRVASPGAARAPRDDPETTPLPVSMSTAWAFRIDCHAGGVRRSWWCVYADTGSNWERVQRLAITE